MPTESPAYGIRVEFHDFIPDPSDPDHMYRAMSLAADRVTFEDGDAVFWNGEKKTFRFPASTIRALTPFPPLICERNS